MVLQTREILRLRNCQWLTSTERSSIDASEMWRTFKTEPKRFANHSHPILEFSSFQGKIACRHRRKRMLELEPSSNSFCLFQNRSLFPIFCLCKWSTSHFTVLSRFCCSGYEGKLVENGNSKWFWWSFAVVFCELKWGSNLTKE